MKNNSTKNSTSCELTESLQVFNNIQKHIVLDSSEWKYLESIFSVHKVEKNTVLQHQGQMCKKLFFVEEGSLRAFNINEEGKEATIMFAVDDWWITDMYCFSKQLPAMLSLEALEDSKVVVLNFGAFESLLARLPKFERFFRILFQNAYAREQLRALDNISLPTEERYRQFVIKYPQIVQKVTQKQIASYLGVTPEFLSSVKKK